MHWTLVLKFGLSSHLYGDDTQIYGDCSPAHVDAFLSNVSECLSAIVNWMHSNRLQLNSDKTECLWCATSRHQHRLPAAGLIIGSSSIEPSLSTRTCRWRTMSSTLSHAASAVQYLATGTDRCLPVTGRCFGPQPAWLLQQCAGWATCQLDPASSVRSKRHSEHIMDALNSLHYNTSSSVAVLTCQAVNGSAPVYLSSYFTRIADMPSRLRLWSPTSNQLVVTSYNLATVGRRAFPISWTVSLHISCQHHRS